MSNKIKIQSVNGTTGKETVYVDVDDEITTIINKVQDAKGKVVALVLPKRAPVLQSIVNMKLLKRTADAAEKNLVLVTAEASLMPLAGAVGLYVASSPTSKPSVPNATAGPDDEPEDVGEPLQIVDGNTSEGDDFDRAASGAKTVGELTAARAAGNTTDDDVDDAIDMSSDADDDTEDTDGAAPLPSPKKNRRLLVPNFDSFRKKLALGVLGLALLVTGWVFAFMILPSVTITVRTDNSTVTTNMDLVLDTAAKTLDQTSKIVPATSQSQQKTASQQVAATGQQNNGEKATGTVTILNCTTDHSEVYLPAGRSLSAGGRTYTLNASVDLPLSGLSGNNCQSFANITSTTVGITALKGGEDYNVSSGTKFTVSTTGADGFSSSEVRISGSASGGTDDIITIVQQSDIDGATSKIVAADSDGVKQQLVTSLQAKGLQPVPSTFVAGTPEVTSSAKAGDAATSVTVTSVTTYTMLGAQKADLRKLVVASVSQHINTAKQVILDDGIANAQFTQDNPTTPAGANVAMRTKSEAGPQLDTDKLKAQLAGKKAGDIKRLIGQTPGVTSVDIKFSPFWVNVVPKSDSKITINIAKADG